MSEAEQNSPAKFWDIVKADLLANAGHRKLGRTFSAFLFVPGFATIFLHRVAGPFIRTPLDKLGNLIWA